MNVPKIANTLGTLGAVCWSIQLIPQIIINYRRHDTEGLRRSFMVIWALAGAPLAVFNVVQNQNIALVIQPQILTLLSLVTWTQCCYYGSKWPITRCVMIIIPLLAVMAGAEIGLIYGLRIAQQRDVQWPTTLMGVLAGVLLCAGVSCEYYDIWKTGSVRGISFLFCGIDAAGDIFSLASVIFQSHYDYVAIALYAAEFVWWAGIFACGGYYRLYPWICSKWQASQDRREFELHNYQISEHGVQAQSASTSSLSVFRTPSQSSHVTQRHVESQLDVEVH